jgi:acetoin utilization protein AcuB
MRLLYQLRELERNIMRSVAKLRGAGGVEDVLLVRDSMTREVVTVGPETTALEALTLGREHEVRHLPVIEDGRLVGIISDRNLRSAAPPPNDPDRRATLQEIRVGDVLVREVVTASPDDPIEHAASEMYERRIGCLPVVEDDALVGILTTSDVMRAFVRLTGANEPGSRVVVALSGRPAAFAGVAGAFQSAGVHILSVLASSGENLGEEVAFAERVAVFRIDTINPGRVAENLRRMGYSVLWPPAVEAAVDAEAADDADVGLA